MSEVEALLLAYAEDLNDAEPGHEFTIWNREQLLRYHNEGLCIVASLRPDMFTKTVVVKVTPCQEEQTVCDCTIIHRVLGQSNQSGRVFKPLRPRNIRMSLHWTGPKCPPRRGAAELKEYAIESDTNTLFLYPALPAGTDAWVKIECSTAPDAITLDSDIMNPARCAFSAAVLQWVMYRAKGVDELSPALREASKEHFTVFGNILGLVKASDETYRAILKASRR
jgi:hypothetical protein